VGEAARRYDEDDSSKIGTWKAKPGEVRQAVAHALKVGYTHLNCALIYQNEDEVGAGIRDSGVKRENIFITSKLWCTDHSDVAGGLEKTLTALGTAYLDLYVRNQFTYLALLIH
jgi:glycerol 2-dehydrogenase (NADP+)